MQVQVMLDILKHDLIVVMNSITFLLIFETTKSFEINGPCSKGREFNFIAGVVLIGTSFGRL